MLQATCDVDVILMDVQESGPGLRSRNPDRG
jgi:hypothetical protein